MPDFYVSTARVVLLLLMLAIVCVRFLHHAVLHLSIIMARVISCRLRERHRDQ